jgi:organic radical activating enzyme
VRRSVYTPVEEIVAKVMETSADTVIVTGGEPTIHNLEPLCRLLKENGKACFLETAGNHPITGDWDWICLSPKLNSPPLGENLKKANELKVLIEYSPDFEWAESNAASTNNCLLFLQPEWSRFDQIIPEIVDYIKQNTYWILSLQTHKYIGIK